MKLVPRSELHRQGHYVAPVRTLIFVGLLLLIFGGVGALSFIRSLQPLMWKSVPCSVTRIAPTDDSSSEIPFGAAVEYSFRVEGRSYRGNKLGIPGWKDSRDQILAIQRLGNRSGTTCYLPNGKPESAVLLRPSANSSGLAFVGFSATVGWILYLAHIHRHEETGKLSRKLMPAVALFFGTLGLLMLLLLSLPVWIESIQVPSWTETPATVMWSKMSISTSGGKNRSTSYKADICYEYEAEGRTFRQNRVHPGGIEISSHMAAKRVLAEHPAGMHVTCFVHPDKPERSVLVPKVGWAMLWTFFPLPFFGVGLLATKSCYSGDKPGNKERRN